VYWNFETKGILFPSKEEPKKDAEEEGNGPRVKPGVYRAIFQYNQSKDSTQVRIEMQPGLLLSEEQYALYLTHRKEAEELVSTAEKAYARIRNAEKSIALIKDALTFADDSTRKKVNERVDSIQKKIDPIEEAYFGKQNQKGIQDDSHTLINQLYNAVYSIGEYENGSNSAVILANCRKNVEKTIAQIDSCMLNEYETLRKLVSETRFEYFKQP
jgi:hypothetical protein